MDVADLTEQEAFKAGFLAFCKEAGLSEADVMSRIKLAKDPTWGQFAYEMAQNFNPLNGRPKSQTGLGSYADVLSRWYNPWTKQQISEKGEETLMRIGQGGWGLAGAGAAGAGLAAAPVLTLGTALGSGVLGLGSRALGGAATGLGAMLGAGAAGGPRAANPLLSLAAMPIVAGLAAGGGLGWGAAKMTEPNIRDEDLRAQEIEQVYRTQAKRLKARRDYEKYRQARGL